MNLHIHVHVYIHFILFRHETGGELHVVEDILHHIYATPTLTPNMLSDRIRPLLYTSKNIIYIHVCIQWNPSIPDTNGTNGSVLITGVFSFQG